MKLSWPSTPVLLQMEATECGAACLAMIMARHGHPITLEAARVACATARDGVDAARLVAAAESYGLETRGLKREPETLGGLPLPMILHWNFDHFVVLEKIRAGRFTILDPACGKRVLNRREFGQSFTGVALVMQPGERFVKAGRLQSTWRTLFDEAKRSPDAIGLTAVLGLLAVAPMLAVTAAIATFSDHVVGQARFEWGLGVLITLLAASVVGFGLALLSGQIAATLRAKIAAHVAVSGMWRALFLPLSFFSQRNAGEVVSRLRLGAEFGGVVAGPLVRLIPDAIALLSYLVILLSFAPAIAVAAAATGAVSVLLMVLLSRRIIVANAASQIAEGAAAGTLTAGMAALETYRLHGRESLLVERVAAAEDTALDREQRIGLLRTLGAIVPKAAGLLLTIVVLFVGAHLVMRGSLTLGGLMACQVLVGLLTGPLVALSASLAQIQEAAGAIARINDLKNYPMNRASDPDRERRVPTTQRNSLRLDNVSFGFSPGHTLLANITLEFAPGRMVAIMGPSGVGKSALARLAAGIIEPSSGTISIGGVPLQDWPPDLLRRTLLYVPQQPAVFSATIEENLGLWDPAIGQADLAKALQLSGLHGVVARRCDGMHTSLSGHVPSLSGGEVQRLALARALARTPAFLVLDETTSALDFATEVEILDRLRASGASVLIVTHRTGTALRCDEMILLSEGGGITRGLPSDLVDLAAEEKRAA
jgi:ABC-type bacteriocin/lantibiotic exporter with double-glycine peptidase domain